MKMNKNLKYFTFTMLSVVVCSCSSNDEPGAGVLPSSEDYITFAHPTVNLNATLSDFADSQYNTRSYLSASIDEFQVWGFCVPNNVEGNKNDAAVEQDWNQKSTFFTSDQCSDVFFNMKVSKNSDGLTIYDKSDISNSGTKIAYKTWKDVSSNENALFSYIAGYVPEGLGSFIMEPSFLTTKEDEQGNNLSHGPKLTFTIGQNGTNIDDDLDHTRQPDALVAATYDKKKSNGRVSLSFFHFMTGIRFKFHNYTSSKDLVIKRVTYKGRFHKSATFDFTTDEPTMSVSGEYAGTFTLFNGIQTIIPNSADYMGGDDPVTLLLLPNPDGTTAEDKNFTLGRDKEIFIEYTIGDKESSFSLSNFTLNYLPQPNTLHTAHFNFIGDEFVVMFQADDNNWENGSDNNVVIN